MLSPLLSVAAILNVILFLLSTVGSSQGSHIMEIILEEEPPMVVAATPPVSGAVQTPPSSSPPHSGGMLEFEENLGGTGSIGNANPIGSGQCNIEFQVMKVYPGRCMRLGRNGGGRGCVSGNHIIPFHPDCM